MKLFTLSAMLLVFSVAANAQQNDEPGMLNTSVKLRNATSINSGGYDFSPAFHNNGLVFVTSRRENGPVDEKTGEPYFELFYAPLDPNGNPQSPRSFSFEINSRAHEGPVTFNQDGNRIYYSTNNFEETAQGSSKQAIFQADRGQFDWENVKLLPFNDGRYSFVHPSISADGRMLYFASDMPGSKGGMDIWVVLWTEGKGWSDPINMGERINTPKDETFPYIHESGTLFFASNGYEGFGKLDLFMINLSGGYFGEAINLGPPFNSEYDDFGITLWPDGRRGFFSSNRPGGRGRDDIYRFDAPNGIQGVEFPEIANASVSVYNENNGRSLAGASVKMYERVIGDNGEEELYKLTEIPNEREGEGIMFTREKITDEDADTPRMITNSEGKAYTTLDVSKEYLFMVEKSGYQPLEYIYKPTENIYNRPIEIALVPDNCITLSGLIENTYGNIVPRATVRVTNGCTQRMTTLSSNVNGTFQLCIEKGCDFMIVAEKVGYEPDTSEISTRNLRGRYSSAVRMVLTPEGPGAVRPGGREKAPQGNSTAEASYQGREVIRSGELRSSNIPKGAKVILGDIYYDYGKASIREGAASSLEELAEMMQEDPAMEIELIAHTDCQGQESFNLKLSLKRAESAKEFLVKKGIAADRIRAFGYGEAVPVNDCDCSSENPCTDEEHEENRRTELRILNKS